MPYIENDLRKKLNPTIKNLSTKTNTIGSLNYCITKLCLNFLSRSTINYVTLNEIIGVLECTKLEMYRRVLATYESDKCTENGDVYK